MKKRLTTVLTFVLFFAFGYTAQAENLTDYYADVTEKDVKNSIILSLDSSKAFVNGHMTSTVQPIVKDGRTLVSLRFIAEGFDAKVDFNTKNQTITIKSTTKTITLKLGDKVLTVNGKTIQMDIAASLSNHSTYIPLRYIGEAFDKKVVYLNNAYHLIIIREPHATALENLNLIRACELLYQGKSIVYSDRFMAVIKENGHLYVSNNFFNFEPFKYQEFVEDKNTVRLGGIWLKTAISNFYLHYTHTTTQEFILYHVDGEKITRVAIEKAPIKAVKTYGNNVYYVTQYMHGILDAHETSNLKVATLKNEQWGSDYLGKPGFYYIFDTEGKAHDWTISEQGIETFGYQRFGGSAEERKATFGHYRIDLNGHHHELVN